MDAETGFTFNDLTDQTPEGGGPVPVPSAVATGLGINWDSPDEVESMRRELLDMFSQMLMGTAMDTARRIGDSPAARVLVMQCLCNAVVFADDAMALPAVATATPQEMHDILKAADVDEEVDLYNGCYADAIRVRRAKANKGTKSINLRSGNVLTVNPVDSDAEIVVRPWFVSGSDSESSRS